MIDVTELKRMMTNAYGDQKVFLGNILAGINALENENRRLKKDNEKLLEQLQESTQ
jgi:hypothetical protein